MKLDKIFSILIDKSNNLGDFNIEFFKNKTENTIKFEEYNISTINYTNNISYQITISYKNWIIEYYDIDIFDFEKLNNKFTNKVGALMKNKTKEWMNEKKKLIRKIKLDNLDNNIL